MPRSNASPPSRLVSAPASGGSTWRWIGLAGLVLAAVFGLSWVGGSKTAARSDPHARGPETNPAPAASAPRGGDELPLAGPTVLVGHVRRGAAPADRASAMGPVAGAEVCVWVDRDRLRGRLKSRCTRTDHDGRYEIVGAPATGVRVTATAKGLIPGPRPGDADGDLRLRAGKTVTAADIVLSPGARAARGRVVDALGGPIEGAQIVAHTPLPITTPLATARSDAEGAFEIWIAPGRHHLRAEAEGYAAAVVHKEVPGPTIELVLAPESSLSGTVVDRDGAPVAGARVVVDDPAQAPGRGGIETLADDAGRFRIGGLAPGRYHPKASGSGAFGETDGSIAVGLAEHVDDVQIVVAAAASLAVSVQRDEQAPCLRGVVTVFARGPGQFAPADIDADGVARFEALLPGTYDVLAQCEGIGQARIEAPLQLDAGAHEVTLMVERGYTVRGTVVDGEDEPLPEAEVMAYGVEAGAATIPMRANCDADGGFVVAGLTPGKYELRALSPSHAWPESTAFVVTHADPDDLEIRFGAMGRVEGYVRNAAGDPVAGASVGVRRANDFAYTTTDADDAGHYALEGLPAGQYILVAEVVGGPRTDSQTIKVSTGDPVRRDLTLDTGAGTIDGTVVGPEGEPVADAWVYAAQQQDGRDINRVRNVMRTTVRRGMLKTVLTDEDGRFSIEGLGEGEYTVLARRPGGGEAWKTNVAAGATTKLRLPQLVNLRGTVTTDAGGSATALVVSIHEETTGLKRTETFLQPRRGFAFDALVPGRYTVTARAAEGNGKTTVGASSGTAHADITLKSRVPVRGRLVDLDTGEPQAGVAVVAGTEDTSLGQLAGEFERLAIADDSAQISNAEGYFTLDLAPGPSRLLALSRDVTTGKYEPHLIRFEVSANDPVGPTFELVGKRVTDRRNVGDVGFEQLAAWCDGIELGKVKAGSAAEAAGLREGMKIDSVDGHSVRGGDCYRFIWLTRVPPGQTITVTPVDGVTVELTAR